MTIFWWKIRYCYFMWKNIRPTIKALWINASQAHDSYRVGQHPRDAVEDILFFQEVNLSEDHG